MRNILLQGHVFNTKKMMSHLPANGKHDVQAQDEDYRRICG
jgi:hypothetical protein